MGVYQARLYRLKDTVRFRTLGECCMHQLSPETCCQYPSLINLATISTLVAILSLPTSMILTQMVRSQVSYVRLNFKALSMFVKLLFFDISKILLIVISLGKMSRLNTCTLNALWSLPDSLSRTEFLKILLDQRIPLY